MLTTSRLIWAQSQGFQTTTLKLYENKGIVWRGSEIYEKKQKTATGKLDNDIVDGIKRYTV